MLCLSHFPPLSLVLLLLLLFIPLHLPDFHFNHSLTLLSSTSCLPTLSILLPLLSQISILSPPFTTPSPSCPFSRLSLFPFVPSSSHYPSQPHFLLHIPLIFILHCLPLPYFLPNPSFTPLTLPLCLPTLSSTILHLSITLFFYHLFSSLHSWLSLSNRQLFSFIHLLLFITYQYYLPSFLSLLPPPPS